MKKLYNFLRDKGFYLALGVGIITFATLIFLYDYEEAGNEFSKEQAIDLNQAKNTEDIADASDAEEENTAEQKTESELAANDAASEADNEIKNEDGADGEEIQNIAGVNEEAAADEESLAADAETISDNGDVETDAENPAGSSEMASNEAAIVETGSDSAIAASVAELTYDGDKTLIWPLEGKIIMPFSMETTTYYATLDVYKCNPGILIEAEEGKTVFAAYEGVVEAVQDTKEYGTQIIVNLGNGYKAIYGQMMNVAVKVGDELGKSSILGQVAPVSDYFKKEGTNLFFEITKDDQPINPVLLIEQ